MTTTEFISTKISAKTAVLPDGVGIVTPDNHLPANLQAAWLISLLQAMYTHHGITDRRDQLVADITSSACRIWFGFSDGLPVAAAAQVAQSDGAVELGRAVSTFPGIGGLLMLLAAHDHFTHQPNTPLVAEVRASAEFAGVPDGLATQTICLSHIGLLAHAFVAPFHHGQPDRQEAFFLSTSRPIHQSEPLLLPDNSQSLDLISATTHAFAKNLIPDLQTRIISPRINFSGWEIAQTVPFNIITPQIGAPNLITTLGETAAHSPFTLLPLEATAQNSALMLESLNAGFIPCGLDRNLGPSGHPIILFGHLTSGTLLAPIILLPHLNPEIRSAAARIYSFFS